MVIRKERVSESPGRATQFGKVALIKAVRTHDWGSSPTAAIEIEVAGASTTEETSHRVNPLGGRRTEDD